MEDPRRVKNKKANHCMHIWVFMYMLGQSINKSIYESESKFIKKTHIWMIWGSFAVYGIFFVLCKLSLFASGHCDHRH